MMIYDLEMALRTIFPCIPFVSQQQRRWGDKLTPEFKQFVMLPNLSQSQGRSSCLIIDAVTIELGRCGMTLAFTVDHNGYTRLIHVSIGTQLSFLRSHQLRLWHGKTLPTVPAGELKMIVHSCDSFIKRSFPSAGEEHGSHDNLLPIHHLNWLNLPMDVSQRQIFYCLPHKSPAGGFWLTKKVESLIKPRV